MTTTTTGGVVWRAGAGGGSVAAATAAERLSREADPASYFAMSRGLRMRDLPVRDWVRAGTSARAAGAGSRQVASGTHGYDLCM
eukprot:CAMPEP_0115859368 /NCGR_PEP_ID=MMETSP0287-20121206/16580_1 /TAXON_ID=412157 /ORGANISM="Chrysochromulina rotalis, Strain UIO044" /LENGTH=83 /DNA_ID=CAMNT_0003313667 /DNA_START=344 /DNA_END=596 /DNA_ORIENTATION=+